MLIFLTADSPSKSQWTSPDLSDIHLHTDVSLSFDCKLADSFRISILEQQGQIIMKTTTLVGCTRIRDGEVDLVEMTEITRTVLLACGNRFIRLPDIGVAYSCRLKDALCWSIISKMFTLYFIMQLFTFFHCSLSMEIKLAQSRFVTAPLHAVVTFPSLWVVVNSLIQSLNEANNIRKAWTRANGPCLNHTCHANILSYGNCISLVTTCPPYICIRLSPFFWL